MSEEEDSTGGSTPSNLVKFPSAQDEIFWVPALRKIPSGEPGGGLPVSRNWGRPILLPKQLSDGRWVWYPQGTGFRCEFWDRPGRPPAVYPGFPRIDRRLEWAWPIPNTSNVAP